MFEKEKDLTLRGKWSVHRKRKTSEAKGLRILITKTKSQPPTKTSHLFCKLNEYTSKSRICSIQSEFYFFSKSNKAYIFRVAYQNAVWVISFLLARVLPFDFEKKCHSPLSNHFRGLAQTEQFSRVIFRRLNIFSYNTLRGILMKESLNQNISPWNFYTFLGYERSQEGISIKFSKNQIFQKKYNF